LETVAAEHGSLTDRSYLEMVISSLGNRIFLLHDIHRPAPLLFQSRWALTFLRGPMTRDQISKLMEPIKELARSAPPMAIPLCTHCHAELGPDVADRCPQCGKQPWAQAHFRVQDQAFRDRLARAAAQTKPMETTIGHVPPVLPPDVTQFYLPLTSPRPPRAGDEMEYQPGILGIAEVVFAVDKRKGLEYRKILRLLAPPTAPGHPVAWDKAEPVGEQLSVAPHPGSRWANVPESLDTGRKLKSLEKAFADHLYSTEKLSLFENRTLGLISAPGENVATFLSRCREAAEMEKRQALEMERVKFTPKFEAIGLEMPDFGAASRSEGSLFSWMNPFRSSKPTSGPASSRQEEKERKLTADYQAKCNEIEEKWKRAGAESTPVQLKPRKVDVRVTHFGLAWAPFWRRTSAAGKVEMQPAYQ
jgi:hypothetical protein